MALKTQLQFSVEQIKDLNFHHKLKGQVVVQSLSRV